MRFSCVLLLVAGALAPTTEAQDDAAVISSLRRALREARVSRREPSAAAASAGRRLGAAESGALCSSGDCLIDVTTGIAGWDGLGATRSDPHWAPVYHGSWIGDSNPETAPSLLVASVSFHIAEPGCASFDLAFAADGKVRAAQLNGRALVVPQHSHRV